MLWIRRETDGFSGLSSLKRVATSGQVFSSSSAKREFLFPARLDLPTSRAQTFSQARSGRFFHVFKGKSVRESGNSTFALGPSTGTGNEKPKESLRRGVITEQKNIFRFLLIKSVHDKSLNQWQIYVHHFSVLFNRPHLQETLGLIIAGIAAARGLSTQS